MAKIPSSKFSTAKKKIASSTFPKTKRKVTSGTLSDPTAKIPSRKLPSTKLATTKKATKQKQELNAPAPLGRPSDEQSRQDVIATLKSRTDALKAAKKLQG